MKKFLFTAAAFVALTAFQSCSKCGHCRTETTTGSITQKQDGSIQCGNAANESGSYSKAAELDCKAWAGKQTPITGVTYASSWISD